MKSDVYHIVRGQKYKVDGLLGGVIGAKIMSWEEVIKSDSRYITSGYADLSEQELKRRATETISNMSKIELIELIMRFE